MSYDEKDQVRPGLNPDHYPENEAEQELYTEEDILTFGSAYSDKTDEEIVGMCHHGDTTAEEFLLNKYKNFVRSKARKE